jgi:hypothetical protein
LGGIIEGKPLPSSIMCAFVIRPGNCISISHGSVWAPAPPAKRLVPGVIVCSASKLNTGLETSSGKLLIAQCWSFSVNLCGFEVRADFLSSLQKVGGRLR